MHKSLNFVGSLQAKHPSRLESPLHKMHIVLHQLQKHQHSFSPNLSEENSNSQEFADGKASFSLSSTSMLLICLWILLLGEVKVVPRANITPLLFKPFFLFFTPSQTLQAQIFSFKS
ncbi:hypothetical protein RJT34_32389 [Clitoria ternatea]|uniref:Uncharacterized protein n=1 Tax=Clitoria ternatea TaxID=43366 RepID=A0AAN9EW02_CLITE